MLSHPVSSRAGENALLLPPAPIPLQRVGGLAGPRPSRRLLAILAMDVAGYSRMIESDDLRTALRLRHLHEHLIRPAVRLHGGRIVSVAGDGAMVAFAAADQALEGAVAIQRALDLLQSGEPVDQRIRLRMGISVGDVLEVEGELYGNALNVAARLEALAEPGGIYLSGAAFDHLGPRSAVRLEALGERKLRKIAVPQRVYRVDRRHLAGR